MCIWNDVCCVVQSRPRQPRLQKCDNLRGVCLPAVECVTRRKKRRDLLPLVSMDGLLIDGIHLCERVVETHERQVVLMDRLDKRHFRLDGIIPVRRTLHTRRGYRRTGMAVELGQT